MQLIESERRRWAAARPEIAPTGSASLELLGKRDDNALRAANVTKPVRVPILNDFADKLSAMGAQAREYILDVVNGEHDAMDAQRVDGGVLRFCSDRRGRVKLVKLNPTVAVWSPQHRNFCSNVLQPNEKVYLMALDLHLAFQFHTKLNKESLRSLKVVNYNKNVVHALKRHVFPSQL
jgi:hypothetical protein